MYFRIKALGSPEFVELYESLKRDVINIICYGDFNTYNVRKVYKNPNQEYVIPCNDNNVENIIELGSVDILGIPSQYYNKTAKEKSEELQWFLNKIAKRITNEINYELPELLKCDPELLKSETENIEIKLEFTTTKLNEFSGECTGDEFIDGHIIMNINIKVPIASEDPNQNGRRSCFQKIFDKMNLMAESDKKEVKNDKEKVKVELSSTYGYSGTLDTLILNEKENWEDLCKKDKINRIRSPNIPYVKKLEREIRFSKYEQNLIEDLNWLVNRAKNNEHYILRKVSLLRKLKEYIIEETPLSFDSEIGLCDKTDRIELFAKFAKYKYYDPWVKRVYYEYKNYLRQICQLCFEIIRYGNIPLCELRAKLNCPYLINETNLRYGLFTYAEPEDNSHEKEISKNGDNIYDTIFGDNRIEDETLMMNDLKFLIEHKNTENKSFYREIKTTIIECIYSFINRNNLSSSFCDTFWNKDQRQDLYKTYISDISDPSVKTKIKSIFYEYKSYIDSLYELCIKIINREFILPSILKENIETNELRRYIDKIHSSLEFCSSERSENEKFVRGLNEKFVRGLADNLRKETQLQKLEKSKIEEEELMVKDLEFLIKRTKDKYLIHRKLIFDDIDSFAQRFDLRLNRSTGLLINKARVRLFADSELNFSHKKPFSSPYDIYQNHINRLFNLGKMIIMLENIPMSELIHKLESSILDKVLEKEEK